MMIVVASIGISLLAAWCVPAGAQSPADRSPEQAEHLEQYHSDSRMDAWIKGLKRPGGGFSCCNKSDCARTDAEWRGSGAQGAWWAQTRLGRYVRVPPGFVLDQPSIDGEAYLCATPNGNPIYCFVRPDIGS